MPRKNSSTSSANASSANTSSVVMAWWLSDGDEECPHCGRMYVYEVEFRCTECDGPGCPHCKAIHAEGHLICPSCIPADTAPKKVRHG